MSLHVIELLECRLVRVGEVSLPESTILGSEQAVAVAHFLTDDKPFESLMVMALNGRGAIVGVATVATGGQHGAAVLPRELLRPVVLANGVAAIIAHNHPSGNVEPSQEDDAFTSDAVAAGKAVGIAVLDHVIVTRSGIAYSYAQAGRL